MYSVILSATAIPGNEEFEAEDNRVAELAAKNVVGNAICFVAKIRQKAKRRHRRAGNDDQDPDGLDPVTCN